MEAILRAASHVLVTLGYEKASTTRIAKRAGVSVGSLYQYFPGKEAIVAELIDRHVRATLDLARAEIDALAAAPLAEALPRLIELFLRAYDVDPALHRVFVEQVPRVGRLERIGEMEASLVQVAAAYLDAHRDERRAVDGGVAAFVLVRALAAVAYSAVVEGEGPARDALRGELTELALRYLGVAGDDAASS